MRLTRITSSFIESIGYDSKLKAMEITFKSGKIQIIQDVSEELHQNFINSESKGKFFNQHFSSSQKKADQKQEKITKFS